MTNTPAAPPTVAGPLGTAHQRDAEHLKLLAIFYFVVGGLNAIGGCVGIIYLVLGVSIAANPDAMNDPNAPEDLPMFMGVGFAGLGLFILVFAGLFLLLQVLAGSALLRRRHRTFCFVVAGLSCLSMPIGTVLGIFTFIVLTRPSVAAMFARVATQHQAGRAGATDGATGTPS